MQPTSTGIKSTAQSGEGYNAEFKIRLPSKVKELAAEVGAFTNTTGAFCLLDEV